MGILGAEGRLHIGGGALHVAEHEHAAPLGNGDAHRELTHGEGNGFRIFLNGLLHLVIGLHRFLVLRQLPVPRCQHHMVVPEHRVILQKRCQRFGGAHIVQEPQGMRQLLPKFLRGEGIFVIGGKGMKEFLHFLFVDEFPGPIGEEKFIQVEGIVREIGLILWDRRTLFDFPGNHGRHLVGKHGQFRQPFVGIEIIAPPVFLRLLLVRIGPVVNLAVRELTLRQLLERRAGQVEDMVAVHIVEGPLRLVGLHPFLGFIHNEQVEMKVRYPLQLVDTAAEINGTLQALQGLKGHHALMVLLIGHSGIQEFIPCHDPLLPLQGVGLRHEIKRRLPGDELLEIFGPGIGNAGPVRHHQSILESHGADKVIGRQGLSETGLRIPQELPAALFKIGLRLFHRLPLLTAKHIGQAFLRFRLEIPAGEFIEIGKGPVPVDVEPLRLRLALHILIPLQIIMEIVVRETFPAAILENGIVRPKELHLDIRRVGLLADAVLHALPFGISDFCPALMIGNARRGIGVNHGNNAAIGLNHIHRLHLFHLLYMGFNKGDFLLIQTVLPVKLPVNLRNGLGPVDIGMGCEILKRNISE